MQVNRLRFAHRGFKNPLMWRMDKIIKRFFNLDSFRMVKTEGNRCRNTETGIFLDVFKITMFRKNFI